VTKSNSQRLSSTAYQSWIQGSHVVAPLHSVSVPDRLAILVFSSSEQLLDLITRYGTFQELFRLYDSDSAAPKCRIDPQQVSQTMPSSSSALFAIGTLLLLHAAYSCSHYRELLQALSNSGIDEDLIANQPSLPVDIWLEVSLGFLTILWSELVRAGSALRPIWRGGNQKGKGLPPLIAPAYQTRDFDIYATRAKAL